MTSLESMVRQRVVVSVFTLLPLVAGCFHTPPVPKGQVATVPITGTLHIDGEPASSVVSVYVYKDVPGEVPAERLDPTNNMALYRTQTGSGGKFAMTTFVAGDGLPEGSYVIAFYWDGGGAEILGTDEKKVTPAGVKFNQKYSIPAKSTVKVKAEKGKPVDLGVLEFTTKK